MCQISKIGRGGDRSLGSRSGEEADDVIKLEAHRTLNVIITCIMPDLNWYIKIHFEDWSKSRYVVLFSGNKLAAGFPSFHLLKGGMGLFRAQMDVLSLPL